MKFRFIQGHRDRFPIRRMCRTLGVSPSGYYAFMGRPESRRVREDRRLLVEIKAIHRSSRGTYGSPRVHAHMKAQGMSHSRKRIARLMRQGDIRAKQKRKFKATTDSSHGYPVAPNLLKRKFMAQGPNQKWVADITYIATGEGWLYLAAIMDLYSRRIVGWSMSGSISRQLALDALEMAAGRRHPGPGLLHHSDRGGQYASDEYQEKLDSYGMKCSMSRKANCWDNAAMESWFHTLKVELVNHRYYQSRRQAKADIFEYIEVFYNHRRSHSALGYRPPAEYEMRKATP